MKRKRREDMSLELTTILSELNEQSLNLFAEHQRKATILEADLEAKRRKQEQRHEERILRIIMSFMNEVAGHTPSQTPTRSMPHYVPPIFSHTHTHPPSNQYPPPSSHPPSNQYLPSSSHPFSPPNMYDMNDQDSS